MAEIDLVRELIELQVPLRRASLRERRENYELAQRAFGVEQASTETVLAGKRPAEWVLPRRSTDQSVVLYLHGGGYVLGSPRSHRHLAAEIGRACDAAVLSLDYRLAPEDRFPAAVKDTVEAVAWLFAEMNAARVIIAGDSAGGGLALAAMIALRDAGQRLPEVGVCLSPWADLRCSSVAYELLAGRDPLLTHEELRRMSGLYLGGASADHPWASPMRADLSGLPPLLIQAGSEEILLGDAQALAAKASRAGVEVTLREWPRMVHVWQWYYPVLREGKEAIEEIGNFVSARLGTRARNGHGRREAPVHRQPATLIQQAHLEIAPWTAGRGFLSWVYQLNGPLDRRALASAIDEAVEAHAVLRVRFADIGGTVQQFVMPFRPGVLRTESLRGMSKGAALEAAFAAARRTGDSLNPRREPGLRATLYEIDAKTSVLALFVAEALVDTDSGSLLCAAISEAYARHAGTLPPDDLPDVSRASFLDIAAADGIDPVALAAAREHWARVPVTGDLPSWLQADRQAGGGVTPAHTTQEFRPHELERIAAEVRTTPYVLILTGLRAALAHDGCSRETSVHIVAECRPSGAKGVIGCFHSFGRVSLRPEPEMPMAALAADTGAAVAQAIDNSGLPSTLVRPCGRPTDPAESTQDPIPPIRFYSFGSRQGPRFEAVRRRRVRLHGATSARLTVTRMAQRADCSVRLTATATRWAELDDFSRLLAAALTTDTAYQTRQSSSQGTTE